MSTVVQIMYLCIIVYNIVGTINQTFNDLYQNKLVEYKIIKLKIHFIVSVITRL